MALTHFQAILDEITEDLDTQAGIILTPTQLRQLQQTNQLSFKPEELAPYNIAGLKCFLQTTPARKRLWDCYQRLSDDYFIVTIQVGTQTVIIQTV